MPVTSFDPQQVELPLERILMSGRTSVDLHRQISKRDGEKVIRFSQSCPHATSNQTTLPPSTCCTPHRVAS